MAPSNRILLNKQKNKDRVRRSRNISRILRIQEFHTRQRVESTTNVDNLQQSGTSEPTLSAEMKIRKWAIKHNITRIAMYELLQILISIGLTYLPSDPRTLLKTPQNIPIIDQANGKVWYCGIQNNLRRIFNALNEDLDVSLNFNIDGIPLFNSAKHEFWPILANVYHSK